jgi:hypothetical protein
MATIDTIRRITIQASTTGVDTATDSLNKLATAQTNVAQSGTSSATVTDTSASKQLSASSAYDKLRLSIDSQYKSQQQLAKGETVLTNALNQGTISTATYASMHDLLIQKYGQSTTLSAAFGNAIGGVKTQMVALSAGMGPVGVFLASLGPWGLAAGVAVTLVGQAFEALAGEADRMGQLAVQLRTLAEVTGLSAQQVQILQESAGALGISGDQATRYVEQFNTRLAELQQTASGPLYTALQKTNGQLLLQFATVQHGAPALQLLAQAYGQLSDQQQKLLLNGAVGGRNSASFGALLTSMNQPGGLTANQTDIISPDQIDQWAKLSAEISTASTSARNDLASIFTGPVLQAELAFANSFLNFSRSAKEFSISGDLSDLLKVFGSSGFASIASSLFNPTPGSTIGAIGGAFINSGSAGATAPVNQTASFSSGTSFDSRFAIPSPQYTASQLKEQVSALGPAATATQQYAARVADLKAQLASGTLTLQLYNQALAGENLKVSETALNTRISLLGQAAPLTDLLRQTEDKLTDARRQGAKFTAAETAMINANVAAQRQAADVQILVTNNVVTADQLRSAKLAELNVLVMQGKLTQDQMNTSMAAYTQTIEKTIQQQQIAIAQLPQLKQLQLQSGDLRLQMDTFATTTATDVGNSLVDIATGAKTATAALQNLGLQAVTALEQMVVKMLVVQPIAAALQATLSTIFSVGAPLNITSSAQGAGAAGGSYMGTFGGTGGDLGGLYAKGNAFHGGRVIPFAFGGLLDSVVTQPTLFPMANGSVGLMAEAGDEAVMPLARTSSGHLGVRSSGQSSPTVHVYPVAGTTFDSSVNADGSIVLVGKMIADQIASNNKKQNGLLPDMMAQINRDPRRRGSRSSMTV